MQGSITQVLRKQGSGFILGEDGCEVFFEFSGLNGIDVASLFVGRWVEYEIQFGPERLRATNIRPVLGHRTSAGEAAA